MNHPNRRTNTPSFELRILTRDMDNANEGWRYDTARLLRSVAASVYRTHDTSGTLYDRDGKRVGEWRYRQRAGEDPIAAKAFGTELRGVDDRSPG